MRAPAFILPGHADGAVTRLSRSWPDASRAGRHRRRVRRLSTADGRRPRVRPRAGGGQDRRPRDARLHPVAPLHGRPRDRSSTRDRRGVRPQSPLHHSATRRRHREGRRHRDAGAGGHRPRRPSAIPGSFRCRSIPSGPTRGASGRMAIDLSHLHRVQRVRGRLPGREQHPGGRQGPGDPRPRDALDSRGSVRRRGPRVIRSAGAVHAVRERPVRGGLPGRRDRPQRTTASTTWSTTAASARATARTTARTRSGASTS